MIKIRVKKKKESPIKSAELEETESQIVNFHKFAKGWKVLFAYLLQCQYCLRIQPPKAPEKGVNKLKEMYTKTLEDVFEEEDMWNMSYRCEPKNT